MACPEDQDAIYLRFSCGVLINEGRWASRFHSNTLSLYSLVDRHEHCCTEVIGQKDIHSNAAVTTRSSGSGQPEVFKFG